jgi:hypothetical protein
MAVGAAPHPLGRPALAALVVTERHRVARLARVRDLVLVAQVALFLSLAVVTGLGGADATRTVIIAHSHVMTLRVGLPVAAACVAGSGGR